MSQHDEANIAAIYNGEPAGTPQQEAAKLAMQRERRANLPKFKLAEGERLYIPRDKLIETNRAYFKMFDEMKAGTVNAAEEAKSFMESVLFEAYRGEINKLQEDYSVSEIHNDCVHEIKKELMAPGYVRKGIFRRRKPNYALRLCQKEAELESEVGNAVYRENIAKQEVFLYGAFDAIFEELEDVILTCVRRKNRGEFKAFLEGIQDAYNQRDFEMLENLIKALEVYVCEMVRWKRRRAEIFGLIDRLKENCKREQDREIEERKARTSDITVLRFIAEILKGKRGVPELPPPQPEQPQEQAPEDYPIPECYDSQSSEEYFVSDDMLDDLYGAELDALYELEDELDELEETENEKSEEEQLKEIEPEEPEVAEFEDGEE